MSNRIAHQIMIINFREYKPLIKFKLTFIDLYKRSKAATKIIVIMPEYIPSTMTAALFPLQSDMIAKVTAKGQALQYFVKPKSKLII